MAQMSLPSQKAISFKQSPPNQSYKLLKLIFQRETCSCKAANSGFSRFLARLTSFNHHSYCRWVDLWLADRRPPGVVEHMWRMNLFVCRSRCSDIMAFSSIEAFSSIGDYCPAPLPQIPSHYKALNRRDLHILSSEFKMLDGLKKMSQFLFWWDGRV